MPLRIHDRLKSMTDSEEVESFFNSAFEQDDRRDLSDLRNFLIDILFDNRDKCTSIVRRMAFVYTCLKLKYSFMTIGDIYDAMAKHPVYLIALLKRDRTVFDQFLEGYKDFLNDLTPEEKAFIAKERRKANKKAKKYERGESKNEYRSPSRSNAWINDMKELIWKDFYATYVSLHPERFMPYSEMRKLLSDALDGEACFVCETRFSSSQTKLHVGASETPVRIKDAGAPDTVLICQRCFLHCREHQISPNDEVSSQNQFWDQRYRRSLFFKL